MRHRDELQAEIARTLPTKLISAAYDPIGLLAAEKSSASSARTNRTNRNAGCRNCDSLDHLSADCKLDKADCSVCGLAVGHLDHHCLAQSDCPTQLSRLAAGRTIENSSFSCRTWKLS